MEDENRKKMLQANDLKLKARESLFPEQAKSPQRTTGKLRR
jgi:hypothetical protein